ncbi:MAG: carbohydrate-binding protein, partial [Lachnospiraceae bacterium]|nr:carbohydrate-binding protein [Lachnospiraceae bacterium]
LNLMSYDYNQNGTGENAPWSQVYDMVNYYQARGVAANKLVIGVPFYGYGQGGTAYTFAEIVGRNPANAYKDYADGIYYNGINTIKEKTEYSKNFGGIMTWEVGQDSFGQYSLLNVMKTTMAQGIDNSQPTQQQPVTTQKSATKDWNAISYIANGTGNWNYDNTYKFFCADANVNAVNLQRPGFASQDGIYVTLGSGISSCSLGAGSYAIQGAGIVLYTTAFNNQKETQFTITDVQGTHTCYVYNEKAGTQQQTTQQQTTQQQTTQNNGSSDYPAWDSSKAYSGGDKVTYNGKIYQALWWTQGANPETSTEGVWKLIGTVNEQPETTTKEPETTKPAQVFDAFSKIEAEAFDSKSGMVVDTNNNVSGGKNLGGVVNNTSAQYNRVQFSEKASAISITYASKTGDAQGNVEVYADNNKVGTVNVANTGSDWSKYITLEGKLDQQISAGEHIITLKFVTTGNKAYVCKLDYFKFVKATEYVEPVKTSKDIEINGFQISSISEGIRAVYSASDKVDNQSVTELGLVYAYKNTNTGTISEDEIYVGSKNQYVASYSATEKGKLDTAMSKDKSYTMTMLFADNKTKENFTATYLIRVYAKLADGSYVYSDVSEYSIFSIAQKLYNNNMLHTFATHNYIYNSILKVVDPNYTEIDFQWRNTLAKPTRF